MELTLPGLVTATCTLQATKRLFIDRKTTGSPHLLLIFLCFCLQFVKRMTGSLYNNNAI